MKTYTYYTLDRTGRLEDEYKNFGSLVLLKPPKKLIEEGNKPIELITKLFPDGISLHGVTYLHNIETNLEPENLSKMRNATIESVFELIRAKHFPKKPSRFTSVFGWKSIEDANLFKQNYSKNLDSKIYKFVSDKKGLKVDMNWLTLDKSFAAVYHNAFSYWSQEPTDNPSWEVVIPLPVKIELV